jgi:FtsP/CotA-like multicopper oxidase with cupredoxin domain
VIRWTILPGVAVDAYAFNGQIPGPRLRFREGDHVRINVTNRLPESTTVHWHGLVLPNVMDGPAHITQGVQNDHRMPPLMLRYSSEASTLGQRL